MEVVSLIIISQAVSSIFILSFQDKNKYANKLLISILVAFGFWMLNIYFREADVYTAQPSLYFMPLIFSFAFGPLIYFYIRALTNHKFRLTKAHFWHFTPVVIQFCFYTICFLLPYSTKRWFWLHVHSMYTLDLETILVQLSLILYLIYAIRYFRNYRNYIRNHFSAVSKINLRWLRIVISLFLVLSVIWLVDFLGWLFLREVNYLSLLEILMSAMVLFLALGGILQHNLSKVSYNGKKERASAKVSTEIQADITNRLIQLMEVEQLYLKPELTITEFAKNAGYSSRIVSTHINHDLGKSFTDFVNFYRVQAFLKQCADLDTSNLTLLGIAMTCGFNSKSSFNRIFKKEMGTTPREYLKKIAHK